MGNQHYKARSGERKTTFKGKVTTSRQTDSFQENLEFELSITESYSKSTTEGASSVTTAFNSIWNVIKWFIPFV